MDADSCVNFESLTERMQHRLVDANFPDKTFIQLMYNCNMYIKNLIIPFFYMLPTFTNAEGQI